MKNDIEMISGIGDDQEPFHFSQALVFSVPEVKISAGQRNANQPHPKQSGNLQHHQHKAGNRSDKRSSRKRYRGEVFAAKQRDVIELDDSVFEFHAVTMNFQKISFNFTVFV